MTGKTATGNGGKFAYYDHAWQTKANANLVKKAFECTPARVQADRLEAVVWREVKAFLTNPKMTKELLDQAHEMWISFKSESPELKLKKKIHSIKGQIEALAERIGRLPKDFDAAVLISELSKLQGIKRDHESELENLKQAKPEMEEPLDIKDFETFRRQLLHLLENMNSPEAKAQLVSKVVQKVIVFENGIEIFFNVGKDHYKHELGGDSPSGSYCSGPHSAFFKVVGLNSLTFGAGNGTQTRDLRLGKATLYQLSYSRV